MAKKKDVPWLVMVVIYLMVRSVLSDFTDGKMDMMHVERSEKIVGLIQSHLKHQHGIVTP